MLMTVNVMQEIMKFVTQAAPVTAFVILATAMQQVQLPLLPVI